jgi:hypothetical protein
MVLFVRYTLSSGCYAVSTALRRPFLDSSVVGRFCMGLSDHHARFANRLCGFLFSRHDRTTTSELVFVSLFMVVSVFIGD